MAFNEERLRKALCGLPANGTVIFSACCAERLLPGYVVFSKRVDWGNPEVLRRSLESVWGAAAKDTALSPSDERRLSKECMTVAPDMDEFGDDEFASTALDASTATVSALRCAAYRNPDDAVDAASFAYDTAYMRVQELLHLRGDESDFDIRIAEHPLVRRELERQQGLLDQLSRLGQHLAAHVAEIREHHCFEPAIGLVQL